MTKKQKSNKSNVKLRVTRAQKKSLALRKMENTLHQRVSGTSQELHQRLGELTHLVQVAGAEQNKMWTNERVLYRGLMAAEDHMVLIRRVFNDALSGLTRVKTIERPENTLTPTTVSCQVIDWGWYAEQLDFSNDRSEFISGVLVADEDIKRKAAIRVEELKERRRQEHEKARALVVETIKSMGSAQADSLREVMGDPEAFTQRVRETFNSIPEDFLPLACHTIREMLEKAPTVEEMQKEAAALSEKIQRVAKEVLKKERGEPYDEAILLAADLEIANAEAQDTKHNLYPEGATLFGG